MAARLILRSRHMRDRVSRLVRDCRATVAIEFAFTLPILCMMVFGLYEVTEGVSSVI
jgi:Flp pilus assembly protein TadG